MNRALTFLTAPITALFLPQVHRDAAKSSAGRGILYLLYLTALSTVFLLMIFLAVAVPQGDEFARWSSAGMPTVILTPEGLSLENQSLTQPVRMENSKYGLVAIIDMKKTAVTEEDFGPAYLYVTSQKIYLKKAPGQLQEYDVTRNIQNAQKLPPRIRITGEIMQKFYQNIKNAVLLVVPLVILVVVFILNILGTLLYSLIGLLLNLLRKKKLGYGSIFALTCFATTAGFTLAWLKMVSPLRVLPVPYFVFVLVNLVYMFVAFKITDEEAAKV